MAGSSFAPKRQTLADKAAACTDVQRQLKKEAAESRLRAAKKPKVEQRTVASRKW